MSPLAFLCKVLAPMVAAFWFALGVARRYGPNERLVRALTSAVRWHGWDSPEARVALANLEAYKRSLL